MEAKVAGPKSRVGRRPSEEGAAPVAARRPSVSGDVNGGPGGPGGPGGQGRRAKGQPPGPAPGPGHAQGHAQANTLAHPHAHAHANVPRTVSLFGHLPHFDRWAALGAHGAASVTSQLLRGSREPALHPAIIRLGLAYADYAVLGAQERCRQMLLAFQAVFRDYQAPPDQAISRHLEAHLRPLIAFLVQARPLGVAMGHAIRHLKLKIATLPPDTTEAEARAFMCAVVDSYVRNRIDLADELIAQHGCSKIRDGDVLLAFAHSAVVLRLLLRAHRTGRRFRVVVVDSRPFLEGRRMLRALVRAGIDCTYLHLAALGHVLKEVTTVLLGAHALYSNGALLSRAGTAAVALLAHAAGKPVIVCCESLKFSDGLLLDSIVYNELGDPDALLPPPGHPARIHLAAWRAAPSPLRLLNILYDVTPPEMISLVISEVGLIPVTSIPVVLREYNSNANASVASH